MKTHFRHSVNMEVDQKRIRTIKALLVIAVLIIALFLVCLARYILFKKFLGLHKREIQDTEYGLNYPPPYAVAVLERDATDEQFHTIRSRPDVLSQQNQNIHNTGLQNYAEYSVYTIGGDYISRKHGTFASAEEPPPTYEKATATATDKSLLWNLRVGQKDFSGELKSIVHF